MGLYKPSELRQFLESLGVSPKKGLSQNFLIDGNILKKMVEAAQLKKGETVLEIGPGPGALTEALLGEGVRVIAIEKDEVLARHLERLDSRDSLRVIQEDIRHVDLAKLLEREGKVKVVANIPYSITGLLLQTLLPLGKHIQSLHLMVQKEVAD
ncbi:MAG: ribosomal RNA small subunit methyltransferase A, partial [Chlamydiia bacterium]|nr:ribosomal RNA small subunit methyltransferase A [Chlamydiia bacterium]